MSLTTQEVKFFKLAVGNTGIGKTTSNDIEARCPVCGDSQKSKNKKRLHLYNKNGLTQVNCFNGDCPVHNKTMYSFLRDFYPSLLTQYKRETFTQNMNSLKKTTLGDLVTKKTQKIVEESPVQTQDLSQYMMHLKDSDEGIMYLRNRGIEYRPKSSGKWYFGTQDLKIDDTLYKITNSIVIPLYWKDEMYGFYSRSTTEKSFITYMNDVNIGYKIWNWFNIDKSKPVYIFEGVFDAISSQQSNCIALLGAKLPDERLKELNNPVFCLDNDATGIKNMIQYAKQGYQVYVQPNNIKEKDFNEILLNNTNLNMKALIEDNLHTGISAHIRLKTLL